MNVDTLGRALGMPGKGVDERGRGCGRRTTLPEAVRPPAACRGLRRGRAHQRDEVGRRVGLGHRRVTEPDVEGALESQEELDPLETADAELAFERVVRPGGLARVVAL